MPDLRQGCAKGKSTEETMPADALVLFGAMGDLAHKKNLPRSLSYGPAWTPGCAGDWNPAHSTDSSTTCQTRLCGFR